MSTNLKAMNKLIAAFIIMMLGLVAPAHVLASGGEDSGKIDPKEIIFAHLGDGYGWEVPFGHHHRIPLPVIVRGTDGWHCFSSAHLDHGHSYVDNGVEFRIAGNDSPYKGKVVEIVNGGEVRPWDFSITKNVCALFISVLLVGGLMIWLARFHRHHPLRTPRKGLGAVEAVVPFVYDARPAGKAFCALPDDSLLFHPCNESAWAYSNIPRRREPYRQYRRNACPFCFDLPGDQYIRQQALLEGDFLAGSSASAQVPPAHHAGYRSVRHLHKARSPHSASFRQHDGWAYDCDNPHSAYIHLHGRQPGGRRSVDSGVARFLHFHAAYRRARELHPGIRFHHAVHSVLGIRTGT